jgi:hypothetical protein
MNPMIHDNPSKASDNSQINERSSQELDRASKLLVDFISQLNKEEYE